MGTFGKALGSFGAYIAASREIVDYLVNRARSFIFSTALPPAVLAASLAALGLVDSVEGARLRKRVADNTDLFRRALQEAGFSTPWLAKPRSFQCLSAMPDQPWSSPGSCSRRGYLSRGSGRRPCPAGSCRLRCTVMATHTMEELAWAAGNHQEDREEAGGSQRKINLQIPFNQRITRMARINTFIVFLRVISDLRC